MRLQGVTWRGARRIVSAFVQRTLYRELAMVKPSPDTGPYDIRGVVVLQYTHLACHAEHARTPLSQRWGMGRHPGSGRTCMLARRKRQLLIARGSQGRAIVIDGMHIAKTGVQLQCGENQSQALLAAG